MRQGGVEPQILLIALCKAEVLEASMQKAGAARRRSALESWMTGDPGGKAPAPQCDPSIARQSTQPTNRPVVWRRW